LLADGQLLNQCSQDHQRGYDRYWIGRLFASYERIVVDKLAMK
jgi:hypothetical protein